ncbi:MAG: 3-deoxy-D-manno-octulosonic acid transferase [Armatimonadetes bacterium]|nr:3-deoxy-D-manno-octulosonic acid transferase [Armatimonadota bacterium]
MARGRLSTTRLLLTLLAYDLLLLALLPAIACYLGYRALVLKKRPGNWRHRFGVVPRLPKGAGPRIWVHAVSAGEMAAARPVLTELRRRFPKAGIALSTHTDTGLEVARKSCAEADVIFHFPFDWPDVTAIALWRILPDLIVVVEKELWPNFLGTGRLLGARIVAVNGRVSDRMLRRARWAPGFVRWLYLLPDRLCVQSDEDARRLRALGLDGDSRIVVAGNTKVDTLADRDQAVESTLASELEIAPGETWLVAGSTHPGEEERILEAFARVREEVSTARLLLAPRHLERVPQVSALLAERGLQVVRRSDGRHEHPEAVVVLDTMGELRAAYAFATVGFVGGTLVPVGGHNLLEPPAAGVPVAFGPHTENCPDTAALVLDAEVGVRVDDADALAVAFLRFARDPELRADTAHRAEDLIQAQRGASARCVAVAAALLEKPEL